MVKRMSDKKTEAELPLIDAKGRRQDGRKLDELRPIKLQVGYLSRADGSAYIEHGKNKVVAAVYGPRELHPRHLAQSDRALLRVNYRMATFSVSDRKRPAPSRREHEISMVLRQALEPMLFLKMYPRAVVDVYIMVLEADGGSRCASATVASLALADAGIPMRGLIAGCAAGKIDGKVILDLSDIEDKVGEADVPLAMAPDRGEITLLQMDGKLTTSEFAEALRLAEDGIHQIQEMQRAVLLEKYAQIRDKIGDDEETAPEEDKGEPEKETKAPKKRAKRAKTEKKEVTPKTTKKGKRSKTKDEDSKTKE
jgi:exosome complex component RRP41